MHGADPAHAPPEEEGARLADTAARAASLKAANPVLLELETARDEARTEFTKITPILDLLAGRLETHASQLTSSTAATTSLAAAVTSITSRLENLEDNPSSSASTAKAAQKKAKCWLDDGKVYPRGI